MATTTKTHWTDLTLYTEEGEIRYTPEGDRTDSPAGQRWLAKTLTEYRDCGTISGYYLTRSCNPDAGLRPEQIDWSGLDETAQN